jgi:hypothetical protein
MAQHLAKPSGGAITRFKDTSEFTAFRKTLGGRKLNIAKLVVEDIRDISGACFATFDTAPFGLRFSRSG